MQKVHIFSADDLIRATKIVFTEFELLEKLIQMQTQTSY